MKLETFRRLDNHDMRIRHLEANESGSGEPGTGTSPFTPALKGETTDPDIGDGTAEGLYTAVGQWVDVEFEIVIGTGYSAGTGEWSVELPFAPAAADDTPVGLLHLIDSTDETSATNRRVWALTSRTGELRLNIRGTDDSTSRWASPTVPFTFAVGDRLIGQARFRVNVVVPQLPPTLENVTQALETTATTTHTITLSGGTADKLIVLCHLEGTTTDRPPSTPTGWTALGSTAFTNGGNLCGFYREATSETSVVITTASNANFGWYTADVIDGNLPGTLVNQGPLSGAGSGVSVNPAAVSGDLTSYLGIAAGSQWGSSVVNTPPTVWPGNLFDNRLAQYNNTGVNDARMAVATGGFVAVDTVDPDAFTWDASGSLNYLTIAIPAAV